MAEAVTLPPTTPEIPPEPALTIAPALEEPPKPAEPYRHPFDVQAEQEELSLLEELKTQGFTPPGVDIVVADPAAPEIPPVTETPPAEIPPAAKEEPPAPEVPPVAKETTPAAETPPAEPKKEVGKQWRLYRQEKKAREAAEVAAAAAAKALEERKAAPPVDPNIEPGDDELPPLDDPITKLRQEIRQEMAELKDRQAKSDAQLAADRANAAQQQEIQKQESDFLIAHPDYRDAMNHLVESRREEYDTMGIIDHGANQWLINREEQVKRFATEEGKDPENDAHLFEAARELSFRTLIQQDRQALIVSCRAEGINVAERVYKLAQLRNFNGAKAAPPPAPAAVAQQEADAAKLRVKTAMAQLSTTKSLSAVSPTKAIPDTRQIKNREDVLTMSPEEINFLDKTRPGWDKDIFQ